MLAFAYAITNYCVVSQALNGTLAHAGAVDMSQSALHDITVAVKAQRQTVQLQLGLFSGLSFFVLAIAPLVVARRAKSLMDEGGAAPKPSTRKKLSQFFDYRTAPGREPQLARSAV